MSNSPKSSSADSFLKMEHRVISGKKDCLRITSHVQESGSLMYYPENVMKKDNGMILVKPGNDYFENSNDWKYCCLGVFHNESVNLDLIKDDLLKKYGSAGLLNVFSHQLGFLVLKFDSALAVSRAIDCSPLYVNDKKLHVHKWREYYHTSYPLAKEKVWIEISNIPFSYWSVEGLCLITSAIGKPVSFHNQTFVNATNKSPSEKALVCVEIMMGASRPCVIMTSLSGHSDKYMAMVNVAYLQTPNNCLMCLSLDHKTDTCEHVRELIPGTYNQNQNGKNLLEFIADYYSDSQDDSTLGDLKEPKSYEDHEELAVNSPLIRTTIGVDHEDLVQDSVFQMIGNNVGPRNDSAAISPARDEQIRPLERHSECHSQDRDVEEAPPQKIIIEQQLTPKGAKRGRGRPRKQSLKQIGGSSLHTLSISDDHEADVAAPQGSIAAPQVALKSAKRGRGRPRKKQQLA